jgi:hypothetical protein
MDIISDLDLSERSISLNSFSIPGNKSGEPQIDILDDELLKMMLLSSCSSLTAGLPLLGP